MFDCLSFCLKLHEMEITDVRYIAQMNIATALYDLDDPRMHGFMSRLDEINALAEQSPGFIWRLKGESGNATDLDTGLSPSTIVNMSVWKTVEDLHRYVYKSVHLEVLGKKREWFQKLTQAHQVLWWIEAGHEPTLSEGLHRLEQLRKEGPTSEAFTFTSSFAK